MRRLLRAVTVMWGGEENRPPQRRPPRRLSPARGRRSARNTVLLLARRGWAWGPPGTGPLR